MKWQPIDTAPKDRSVFVLFRGGKVSVARWDLDEHAKNPSPYWRSDIGYVLGKLWSRTCAPVAWLDPDLIEKPDD